jgi:hypothetical protein
MSEGVKRKVENILNYNVEEDEELKKSLIYIDSFFENNNENEKLRSDLELKLFENHKGLFNELEIYYIVLLIFKL